MNYTEKFWKLSEMIKTRVPGFKIKFKNESPFMKFLSKLLFFNKGFMTSVTTTIGTTVYFANRAEFEEDPGRYFYILCHEYVHILDYVKHPVLFSLGYVFPQVLATLALFTIFAFLNPWFLLFLIFLLCLFPIPSPGRTWAELRGYGMDCAVRTWEGHSFDGLLDIYVKYFTGPTYYYMCPNGPYIKKQLEKYITDEKLTYSPAYTDVYDLVKN